MYVENILLYNFSMRTQTLIVVHLIFIKSLRCWVNISSDAPVPKIKLSINGLGYFCEILRAVRILRPFQLSYNNIIDYTQIIIPKYTDVYILNSMAHINICAYYLFHRMRSLQIIQNQYKWSNPWILERLYDSYLL